MPGAPRCFRPFSSWPEIQAARFPGARFLLYLIDFAMENIQPLHPDDTPCVSVIIPTFNAARYIRYAVDSVLSQSFPSYEVIVIDDGSTDNTRDVLMSYGDRIHYVFQNNKGVSAARNSGLDLARGRFVAFLDADDYFLPDKLHEQVAAFKAIPSLDIVHSGWRIVNEAGATIKEEAPWHHIPELNLEAWLLWKPVFPGAMMFRKGCLEKVGGFDTRLHQAEDVDLVFRLALIGSKAAWLRKSTVCYRRHGENTVRNSRQQAKDLKTVLDNLFARRNLPEQARRIERKVRYYTLIWIAWQLYLSGGTEHISEYLGESLTLSVYYPTKEFVVVDWIQNIAQHCFKEGKDIRELRAFWPYFRDAAQIDDLSWHPSEDVLNWWLDIWWFCLHHDRIGFFKNLKTYTGLPTREIVKRTCPVIFVSTNTTIGTVKKFWKDIVKEGFVASSEYHEVTALYLSLFAEAAFGLHWHKALGGLWNAVRSGFQPRSWWIWLRFFRMAGGYFKNVITQAVDSGDAVRRRIS